MSVGRNTSLFAAALTVTTAAVVIDHVNHPLPPAVPTAVAQQSSGVAPCSAGAPVVAAAPCSADAPLAAPPPPPAPMPEAASEAPDLTGG